MCCDLWRNLKLKRNGSGWQQLPRWAKQRQEHGHPRRWEASRGLALVKATASGYSRPTALSRPSHDMYFRNKNKVSNTAQYLALTARRYAAGCCHLGVNWAWCNMPGQNYSSWAKFIDYIQIVRIAKSKPLLHDIILISHKNNCGFETKNRLTVRIM